MVNDMTPRAGSRSLGDLGDLSIQELQIGRRTVLAASGEIDIATAARIHTAAARALRSGASDLWIDLSEVAFMDSSGIHALLAARQAADVREARFVVICPEGPVLRVLRIAGIDHKVTIHPDRASAHAAG
jgi:anti-sigma B factor antagonist